MIIHDQHVHSKYSEDSNESLRNYFKKAKKHGCSYVVTTEHFDLNPVSYRKDWVFNYGKLEDELIKLSNKYNIKYLLGIEVGYNKPEVNRINEELSKHRYDLVNLSIHYNSSIDYYFKKFFKSKIEETLKVYFNQMIEATSNFNNYDVLSHFDYGFKTAYPLDKKQNIQDYEQYLIKIFNNLISKDKTLEINTKVQESIGNDKHIIYVLNLYKSLGGKNITISSDAHSKVRYLSSFNKYKEIAKQCGFDYLIYYVDRKKNIYFI